MAGGLINIAAYGAQDLYLTGNPEITYFKVVYRRYTNFSIENIRLSFNDSPDFGKTTTIDLAKIGDLAHKMYLEITLPELNFKRNISNTDEITNYTNIYNQSLNYYSIINLFNQYNSSAYRESIKIFNINNILNKPNEMINAIKKVFLNIDANIINNYINLLNTLILDPKSPIYQNYILDKFYYNILSLIYIANNPTTDMINDLTGSILLNYINYAFQLSTYLEQYIQWLLIDNKKKLDDIKDNSYNIAYVKKLGHSIIEYISVSIGGQIIDKHYGEWIDIWYELNGDLNYDEAYNKMIGNIESLTSYSKTKQSYVLYVPLIFWFNRHNGLALPLISLQYHDVQITLKLRKFSQILYFDNVYSNDIQYNNQDELLPSDINNLYEDSGYQIKVNLMVDYIYLASKERIKFAQSIHEYLVDIIQYDFKITENPEFKFDLNFTNLSKELVIIIQRNSSLINYLNSSPIYWTDYGLNIDGSGQSIKDLLIKINGFEISKKHDGNYYNYYIPNKIHNKTPSDGIYIYNFALMPKELQPSGSLNTSRLSSFQIECNIKESMFTEIDPRFENSSTKCFVKIFNHAQNILRFAGGMSSLVFI